MNTENLRTLYLDELQDIHDAQMRLHDRLGSLHSDAKSIDLRDLLHRYRADLSGRAEAVRSVIEGMDQRPGGETCEAMKGSLKETRKVLNEVSDQDVLDAASAAMVQKAAHYEINGYGTLRAWASALGRASDVQTFERCLEQSKGIDFQLSQLAESRLNRMAVA